MACTLNDRDINAGFRQIFLERQAACTQHSYFEYETARDIRQLFL